MVQEACARLGAVTGKGLSALIREEFGVRWVALAMLSFLVASFGTTASEFAGIAAASELFGAPRLASVPLAATLVFLLVLRGSYRLVERVFLAMTVVFFAYIATAFMTTSDWTPVLRAAVVPTFRLETGYVFMLITLIGTTITSYMQFFLQATVIEKGVTARELRLTRADVVISAIFADLVAFFIIVTNAQTLHPAGIQIDTAADAARALEPLAGPYAQALFAIGLIGASLLAASVLPLSSAYVVTEAFGWERGISRRFHEAPVFLGLYSGMLFLGAAVVLIPGMPLVVLMLASQFIDGIQLPIILVFIVLLAGSRAVVGNHASGRLVRAIQWITAVVLGVLSLLLLVLTTTGFGG